MTTLAIRILIANSCTRWRFILKKFSQYGGRTEIFYKFLRLNFQPGPSCWTVPLKVALLVWQIHMMNQFQHQTTKQLKGTLIKWSYFFVFS
jgi:hypothetical protein